MAGSSGGLPIIRLGGLDATQTRAASLHVDNDAGQVGACYVGNAFAFQGDAGEEELVIARTPRLAAPSTMLMAAISLSA